MCALGLLSRKKPLGTLKDAKPASKVRDGLSILTYKKTPIPKSMKIGPNFLVFLYCREQESGKGEGDGGKMAATQPGSG